MKFTDNIQVYNGQPITRQLLLSLLKEYSRPADKIEELIGQKMLIRIKRGVYVAGPALTLSQPEPFLLANHLRGPSYVSLQTALSHWRLIPEKVFEISSMTTRRSKTFETQVGIFTFSHLPLPYYAYGQQRIELAKNQFALIASPEKALCDTVVASPGLRLRSEHQTRAWLLEDMRMDKELLKTYNPRVIQQWLGPAPKKDSLKILANTIEKL